MIALPIAWKAGMARSTWAASPPTMILSVPLAAPSLPPLMGASSMCTFFSANLAAMVCVTCGLIVLMSMTSAPALAP